MSTLTDEPARTRADSVSDAARLAPLLDPRSIALIGASADAGRIGGMPLDLLTRFGFQGDVYPVNPKYQEVFGLRCYPDIESVPRGIDLAVLAIAAHARQREQFGRPIGANQAIKHRLADHWMALDDAWLAGEAAAREMDVHGASQAERALLYAELLAAEAAQAAAQFAVQVHGAMGITWECDAHLYLKRVLHQIARMQAGRTRAWMLERLWALAA